MKKSLIRTAILLGTGVSLWAASVPLNITYQGTLKQAGVPVNGSHNMSFKLTDVSGTAQYGALVNLSNVPVNQGLFSVPLDFSANGSQSVPWQSIQPYIQVTIDGQVLSPTEPLNATPYALMSASVIDGAITPAKLDPAVNSFIIPPGVINAFGGSMSPKPPVGWLACDGAEVSRTLYAGLFQAIGTVWGPGDGSSTFNLPDLRGRTAIGAGQSTGLSNRALGQMLGEENHTLLAKELPVNGYVVADPGHSHGINQSLGASGAGGNAILTTPGSSGVQTAASTTGVTVSVPTGGNAHNVMQPSAVVNYIIKY